LLETVGDTVFTIVGIIFTACLAKISWTSIREQNKSDREIKKLRKLIKEEIKKAGQIADGNNNRSKCPIK
jgi:hypothetical protein